MFRSTPSPLTAFVGVATLSLTVLSGTSDAPVRELGSSTTTVAYTQSTLSASFADATILTIQRPVLAGVLAPGGQRVVSIQQYVGSAWRTVASTTTAADGRYTYTLPVQPRGTYSFRATAEATATESAATSSSRSLQVAGQTKVSATLSTASVLLGSGAQARVSGVVYNTEPLVRQVTLQRRDGTAWTTVASTTSAPDGGYEIPAPQVAGTATYRTYVPGVPLSTAANSASMTLATAEQTKVSAALDVATLPANTTDTAQLSGTVSNTAVLGRSLVLQRLDGATWTDVAGTSSTSTGAYSFVVPEVRGATAYRAHVPATSVSSAATSASQTLTVVDQTKVSASLNVTSMLANIGTTPKISGSVSNTEVLTRQVTLQRRDPAGWTNVSSSTTTSTGGFGFVLPSLVGSTTYRVYVSAAPYATAVSSAGVALTVTEGDGAVLPNWGSPSWRDEFDGASVDTTKWKVHDKTYISYDKASLYAKQCTTASGVLRMRAERVDPATDLFGRKYASCYITSQGKFAQRYGRFEMRAKLPTTPNVSAGLWPSFWLRDGQGSGEIDIMESWGTTSIRPTQDKPENYSWTVHADTNSGTSGVVTRIGGDGRPKGAAPITTAYHRYAAEWTPEAVSFYFDDELVGKVTAAQYPWLVSSFPSSVNIRLHYAVGGAYWGEPNANTVFPADYMVDYVRVWARPTA